ncbi:hypothetical protein [Mycobacterium sp. ZZG]
MNDDNAQTWRDLADALTAEQAAYLANWESHPEIPPTLDGPPSPDHHARALLFAARAYLTQNAAAALYADVVPPPEDGHHYPWEHDGDGRWFRYFAGTTRKVGDIEVIISGLQGTDGMITRTITADFEDIDAVTARQLAAALIEAADEIEALQ